jgi:hypothetical protein
MLIHEFWRDMETHEYWAVELAAGRVTGCAGPLRRSEVSIAYLPDYEYSRREAARLERERGRFTNVPERELVLFDPE